jgi:hypothetical protein
MDVFFQSQRNCEQSLIFSQVVDSKGGGSIFTAVTGPSLDLLLQAPTCRAAHRLLTAI